MLQLTDEEDRGKPDLGEPARGGNGLMVDIRDGETEAIFGGEESKIVPELQPGGNSSFGAA